MATNELKETRKQKFAEMEQRLLKDCKPEDDMFYRHSSEDRIVLSHALFWVMTQNVRGRIAKQEFLLLLRKYQEEMLEAYLTEATDFSELLHYCNVIYNALPDILCGTYDIHTDMDAHRLAAITIVAGGYGGEMPEHLCYELLDDIDFYYNKVECRKIERFLPVLNKLVTEE